MDACRPLNKEFYGFEKIKYSWKKDRSSTSKPNFFKELNYIDYAVC